MPGSVPYFQSGLSLCLTSCLLLPTQKLQRADHISCALIHPAMVSLILIEHKANSLLGQRSHSGPGACLWSHPIVPIPHFPRAKPHWPFSSLIITDSSLPQNMANWFLLQDLCTSDMCQEYPSWICPWLVPSSFLYFSWGKTQVLQIPEA